MKLKPLARTVEFLCMWGMLVSTAFADEAHPTYELYQSVYNKDGSSPLVNAKWWRDNSGTLGADGATPDATGIYYSRGYSFVTPNQTTPYRFDCQALHIGATGTPGYMYVYVAGLNSSFEVGGEGLFLNSGEILLQGRTVSLSGTVTVESPTATPFTIRDVYSGTTNRLDAALCVASDKALRVYAAHDASSAAGQFVVSLTGDCSSFFGSFIVGLENETKGRTTRLVLQDTQMPGTVNVTKSGLLEWGTDASSVGSLTLSDGATLVVGGGTLTVANAFSMAGRVTLSGTLANFANVVEPTVDILTVPASATLDLGSLANQLAVGAANRPASGATLALRENGDGTKTLLARIARKAVYVSPSGDDGDVGTRDAPFKTLAHAVASCAGGIIYALPGTYAEGVCDESVDATQARVHLPANTLLVSTDGAAATTIVGARPTDGGDFGSGATRCARLDAGAILKGFTLTGGFVFANSTANYAQSTGGGVLGADGSVVLDCRITGNTAYRGGGCRGGAYVRCTFGTNTAAEASWTGCDVFGFYSSLPGVNAIGPTRLFDCLFANEDVGYLSAYNKVELYNCTMSGLGNRGANNCKLYNCIVRTTENLSGENDFSRCVLGLLPSASETYAHTDCAVESVALDANARPRRRRSAAIDFGDLAVYLSAGDAAGIDRAYFGTDYAGGPRVVNGAIDAGCGEFNRPLTTGSRVILR